MNDIRDRILGAKPTTKQVRAFGLEFTIRQLSAREQMAYEDEAKQYPGGDGRLERLALLVIHSVFDDTGRRVFQPDDVAALCEAPNAELLHLCQECLALNAISSTEVQELKKN